MVGGEHPGRLHDLSVPPIDPPKIRTVNGLERVNKAIRRRTRVVSEDSILRLTPAVLAEIHQGWLSGRKFSTWPIEHEGEICCSGKLQKISCGSKRGSPNGWIQCNLDADKGRAMGLLVSFLDVRFNDRGCCYVLHWPRPDN